jgi:hypothetical protein
LFDRPKPTVGCSANGSRRIIKLKIFKIHSAVACVGFEIDAHLDFRIRLQPENVSLKLATISPTT